MSLSPTDFGHVVLFDTGALHCTHCGANAGPGTPEPTLYVVMEALDAFAASHAACPPPGARVCCFCHAADHGSELHVVATTRAPEDWLTSGDTGTSARALWSHMMGRPALATPLGPALGLWPAPITPGAFGRCHRLLSAPWATGWRERLHEMSERSPAWARIVAAWEELERLYREELPRGDGERLAARLAELEESDS